MMSVLSWSSLIVNILFIAFLIFLCGILIATIRKFELFSNSTIYDIIEPSEDTKKKGSIMENALAANEAIKQSIARVNYWTEQEGIAIDEGNEEHANTCSMIANNEMFKAMGMIEMLNILTNNNYSPADF